MSEQERTKAMLGVMREFFDEDAEERAEYQRHLSGIMLELAKKVGTLGENLVLMQGELDELKARMPAEDPCDVDHLKEIGS